MSPQRAVAALVLLFCLAGCASVEEIDRSAVNHPAMNLRENVVLQAPSSLTALSSSAGKAGGACTVCAH